MSSVDESVQMEKTWLIQRLEKPSSYNRLNPSAFGGGLRNGGFSDKAMEALCGLWEFDYMGASEFEWGAVPDTLEAMLKYNAKGEMKTGTVATPKAEIYYVCKSGMESGVEKIIRQLYDDEESLHLKESSYLKESIEKKEMYVKDIKGWIELDNHFMFFTDKEMYNKTVEFLDYNKPKSSKAK